MSLIPAWPQPLSREKYPNIYDRLKFRAFVGVVEGASIYRRHEPDVLNNHVMGWIRQLETLGVEQSWWLPPTRAAICVCLLACEGRIWRDDEAMKLLLEHIRVLLQTKGSGAYNCKHHEQLVREAVLSNLPASQACGGPYVFATSMEVAVQKIVDEEIKKCHSIEPIKRMNILRRDLLLLAEKIRGMSPSDLDKWLEEKHRRILFRYVLEDELIKELTEVVARGVVPCQDKGNDKTVASIAESENNDKCREEEEEVEKEVMLTVREPEKSNNTFGDVKSQQKLVNETKKNETTQNSNKKKPRRMGDNSLDQQTVNRQHYSTHSESSNRKSNKSADILNADENTQSNTEREENEETTPNSKSPENKRPATRLLRSNNMVGKALPSGKGKTTPSKKNQQDDVVKTTPQSNSKKLKNASSANDKKGKKSGVDPAMVVDFNVPLTRSMVRAIPTGDGSKHAMGSSSWLTTLFSSWSKT